MAGRPSSSSDKLPEPRPVNESTVDGSVRTHMGMQNTGLLATTRAPGQMSTIADGHSTFVIHEPSSFTKRYSPSESQPATSPQPEQPTKRRRTDTLTNCRRHPRFWFYDGSVVVRCGNALFKVHNSLLSMASPYFSARFSDFTELRESTLVEKCVVYTVDNVDDASFEFLMDALYHANEFMTISLPFNILECVIRASSTLSFPHIHKWALKTFADIWSADLRTISNSPLPNAVESVLLARTFKLDSRVLKRAFYEIIRSPAFDAIMRSSAPAPQLSADDTIRLLWLRQTAASNWITDVDLPPPVFSCRHSQDNEKPPPLTSHASPPTLSWYEHVHGSGIFGRYLYDPISGIEAIWDEVRGEMEEKFCDGCVGAFRGWVKVRQERWWEALDVGAFPFVGPGV
ncbi:hypothetical protein OF83DRAFT_1122867 [Amylostereum chailletii]|nr:hypothetical protein OF83DRAFT_1122867 [Amylostereum chailletii]